MRIEVDIEDLPGVEPGSLVNDLAETLGAYWAGMLAAGERADGGGPLPPNKKGEPMGRGRGTIAQRWRTTKAEGSGPDATASTEPYQEGKYYWAVQGLRRKGVDLVAMGPEAQEIFDDVVGDHLEGR